MPVENRRNDCVQILKSHSEFTKCSKLSRELQHKKDRQPISPRVKQSQLLIRQNCFFTRIPAHPKVSSTHPAVKRYLGQLWLFKQQCEFVYLEYFLQPQVFIFPAIYAFLEDVYKLVKCSPLISCAVSALEDAWNYGFFLPLSRIIRMESRTVKERWILGECQLQLVCLWESWLNLVGHLQYLQFPIADFTQVLWKNPQDGWAILCCRRILTIMEKRCALALNRPHEACHLGLTESALDKFLPAYIEKQHRIRESQVPYHWIAAKILPLILPSDYVYPERETITFLKHELRMPLAIGNRN